MKWVVFATVQGMVNCTGPRKHILNLDSARSQEPSSPTHLHMEMQSHRLPLLLKPCQWKETPLPAAPAYFAHCNQGALLN